MALAQVSLRDDNCPTDHSAGSSKVHHVYENLTLLHTRSDCHPLTHSCLCSYSTLVIFLLFKVFSMAWRDGLPSSLMIWICFLDLNSRREKTSMVSLDLHTCTREYPSTINKINEINQTSQYLQIKLDILVPHLLCLQGCAYSFLRAAGSWLYCAWLYPLIMEQWLESWSLA